MPGAQGPKMVKGAPSDPNYVSRLLLDCVPVFYKIITPASYFTISDRSLFIIPKFIPYSMVPVREDRVRGGRAWLGYSSMGPEFLVTPLHVVCVCVYYLTGTASKTVEPIRRAVSSMDLVGKRNHVLTGAHIPPGGKAQFCGTWWQHHEHRHGY